MLAPTEAQRRTVDPFTLEIISHRLHQITEEAGTTLERVGGTVLTAQRHDYIAALYRANGDILCTGECSRKHVACAGQAVKRIIERFQDDEGIDPGDIFMLNDPYVAAIHQSDVYILAPIHYQDRLVAWSATFVHVMDIGAHSPGGFSPGATEVCHEGVRIPGIKLIERGKVRRDVFDAICNMTRQPALVGLDLKCEIAANNVARARMQELYARYGIDVVDAAAEEMLRYTEQILRRRLSESPDGSWRAESTVQVGEERWTVRVQLTKTGDHLVFDFTGTDPQARLGVNIPYHATFGTCYQCLLEHLGWDLPKNQGAFAPIEVIAPPGTLVNARPPAPVSLNTTSGVPQVTYVADTVLTQMVAGSEKWRAEATAKGGGHRRAQHAGVNQNGWYSVGSFGGIGGGGARATGDGIDCGGGASTTDLNVEWFESNYPFLYLFRRHIQDGGGPGKFRGGMGQELAITLHEAPEGRMKGVAYGSGGLTNSGRGLFGGYPGAPSLLTLRKGSRVQELIAQNHSLLDLDALEGEVISLPHCDFELTPDDVLLITDSSGGGYGDPLDRDPAAVVHDVLQGLVSPDAARDIYGVILRGDGLDAEQTETARTRLRLERGDWRERSSAPSGPVSGGADSSGEVTISVQPLRENLEVATHTGADWVRCAKCKHELCPSDSDWTEACDRKLLAPTNAGPRMEPLLGKFYLEQLSCPSCGTLLNTQMVGAKD